MLDRVALAPDLAYRYPHEISGGQKQRANIARALVLEPTLIVCDEVVAALDVSIQADMLNLFADLQREFDLTYLFISHDLRVVAHVSDRVAVMYFGQDRRAWSCRRADGRPLHPYTQALMSAEPEPVPAHLRNKQRIMLKGEIPSPLDAAAGMPLPHPLPDRGRGMFATRAGVARDRAGSLRGVPFRRERRS